MGRPGQHPAEGIRGIDRCQHPHRGGVGFAEGPQRIDGPRGGELGRAQPRHQHPAPHQAAVLELPQQPVGGRETPGCSLHDSPGHDAVPLQPTGCPRQPHLGGCRGTVGDGVPAAGQSPGNGTDGTRGARAPGPETGAAARGAAGRGPGQQRADRGHRGGCHQPRRGGPPQEFRVPGRHQAVTEPGREGGNLLVRCLGGRRHQIQVVGRHQGQRRIRSGAAEPDQRLTLRQQLVQVGGLVSGDPCREHVRFPHAGR